MSAAVRIAVAPPERERPLRLSDRAYEALRRMIIDGTLAPGAAVSEPELSRRLDFGRAAVRASLLRLSQEGLARPVPRRGYIVSPLTIRDARNILDLRLLLEPRAAYLAAGRVEPLALRRIEKTFAQGYDPARPRSLDALLAANREFRGAIAQASGNQRLAAIVIDLIDGMERYLRLGLLVRNRSDELQSGHRQLVDALVKGDAEAASRIAAGQIEATIEMVMKALLAREDILNHPLAAS
ncbi:MAG: GntR family transcriptional regulator [Alphaproteobacteria bacterium]|nr:GntR family transcriptional regulator [Alphaproteobacteria bacterium]